jgi:hypothetical protein
MAKEIAIVIGLGVCILLFLWHPLLFIGMLIGIIGTYLWIKYPQTVKTIARRGLSWIKA